MNTELVEERLQELRIKWTAERDPNRKKLLERQGKALRLGMELMKKRLNTPVSEEIPSEKYFQTITDIFK